ncbi:hypothetical protein GW884_02130 [Candidatus Falkowbacteria bacterium]|nr:hypothetical protein [Candidatus Falkowbacteria bacterium]
MLLDKYLKLNLKNKIAASVGCFLLVIFGLLYFIIIPTIADIKSMSGEIEEQRIDLEKKYIKGQSLKKLSDNLKSIELKLDLLNQLFINKNRELEFITTLENRASLNRLNQKINLSSPQVADNQDFQKADLQLLLTGKFTRLLKYLLDLESLGYYTNIKSLELSPARSQEAVSDEAAAPDNLINVTMFINADTYWR